MLTRQLILLFLAAATLRVAWVGVHYGRRDGWSQLQYPDEETYVLSARSLAAGNGLIDEFGYRATYMPGYPAFLAMFVRFERGLLWGRIVQAILAAWVAPATYLLAKAFLECAPSRPGRITDAPGYDADSRSIPLIAGVFAAVDPFLVFFSGLLLTEALYAIVLTSAWIFFLRLARRDVPLRVTDAIGAGILLLAAVLLRPATWILVPSGAVLILIVRRFDQRGLLAAGAMVGIVIAGLTPWAARNAHVIGQWRWLTTRGGISLYDGVQKDANGDSNLAWTKTLPHVRGMNEGQWDAYFNQAAREEIRSSPSRVIRLAGLKFLRTWSLRPNVAEYRSSTIGRVSGLWMLLLLISAAIGWWICRRWAAAWILLLWPVIATTALHMLFVASVRYRVPVMPMMMVLSALGIVTVIRLTSSRVAPSAGWKSMR